MTAGRKKDEKKQNLLFAKGGVSIYVRAGSLIQAKTVQHSTKTDLDVNYCDQEINYACLIFFSKVRAKTY